MLMKLKVPSRSCRGRRCRLSAPQRGHALKLAAMRTSIGQKEWHVSAVLNVPDPRYGTRREVQTNYDHVYREELAASQFRFFPCRSRSAASAQIPLPPPEERNPTMDATQELVAALSTDLDASGIELDVAKADLRKLQCEN